MGKRLVPGPQSSALCPRCGSENNGVQNSRPAVLGRERRRVCQDCGARWSTIELHKFAAQSDRYRDVLTLLSDVQGKINSIQGLMTHALSPTDANGAGHEELCHQEK